MTVESASYIPDLNALLPDGDDPRSQGDDHLRLIKTAAKASLPVDLRDVSSPAAGEILAINASGRPENKSNGSTLIVDTSMSLTTSFVTFSGNTETRDNLGLWAAGQPTRFTAPEAMNLLVMINGGSWTGKTSGLDFLNVRFRINGTTSLDYPIAIHQAAATMQAVVFPWVAAINDYLEVLIQFSAWETSDISLTLNTPNITVWRQF